MRWMKVGVACGALALAMGGHQVAFAQTEAADFDQLMGMSEDSLEGEIGSRFNDGLAATNNPELISGDDPRYLWALETKTQCGIALGYLKSSTKDPVSIGKCARAHELMQMLPPPPVVVQTPPAREEVPSQCQNDVVGLVFFEFDSSEVPAEAEQTIAFARDNLAVCGWSGFRVVGHADRSGSDAYNIGLSEERAAAVANAMTNSGIDANLITSSAEGESNPRVATDDGVREPQNRRVEISVR
ncbi:OmpA family protein [Erythrobacter sp. HA6-11]